MQQVLLEQAIEIFIAATLPRVIGRGEVAGHRKGLLQLGVAVELNPIVEGDRADTARRFAMAQAAALSLAPQCVP